MKNENLKSFIYKTFSVLYVLYHLLKIVFVLLLMIFGLSLAFLSPLVGLYYDVEPTFMSFAIFLFLFVIGIAFTAWLCYKVDWNRLFKFYQ